MKKLILALVLPVLFSCNKEIALDVDPQELKTPDYNLLSEAPSFIGYDSLSNKYSGIPVLYLRPFENVSNLDNVTLQFSSNNFARYIIKSDTLFNNDKINIKYADFNRYLIEFTYQSGIRGTHSISIEATIRSVSKTTSFNLTTR